MRMNFIFLCLSILLVSVVGQLSIAGGDGDDSTTLDPEFTLGTFGSEHCIQAQWCNDTDPNCDEECQRVVYRVGECVFQSLLDGSGDPFWANYTGCDSSSFAVQYYSNDNCTDELNGFNLNIGECNAFNDGPNLRVTSCLKCLDEGGSIGAITGIVIGFLLLIMCFCGVQFGMARGGY